MKRPSEIWSKEDVERLFQLGVNCLYFVIAIGIVVEILIALYVLLSP